MKTTRLLHFLCTMLSAALALPAARADVLLGPVTNPANGHEYHLYITEHTDTDHTEWNDAEAAAVALGGHLVTINDAAEQAFVFNTFGSVGGVDRSLWIGLQKVGNDFVWVSGEVVAYTNWHPGLPDNIGGSENYVHMFPSNNTYSGIPGGWNDAPSPVTPAASIIEPIGAVIEVAPLVTGKIVYQRFTNAFANNGGPANPGVELVLMNAGGTGKTVIAGAEFFNYGYIALNADATRVAFVAEQGLGGAKLWVMNAAPIDSGTNPAVMVRENVSAISRICWSPDGKRIAFADSIDSQIYVLNAVDGAGVVTPESGANLAVQVTTGAAFTAGGQPSQAQNPAWSPDGKLLAYSNSQTVVAIRIVDGGGALTPEVATTNEPVFLTTNLFLGEDFPAWSPDGTRLIFASQPGTPPGIPTKSDIAIRTVRQPLAGGGALIPAAQNGSDDGRVSLFRDQSASYNPTYVHEDPNFVGDPSWSTDGTRVTYGYRFAGVPELDTVFSLKPEFEDLVTNPSVALTEITSPGTGTPGGRRASFQPSVIAPPPALADPTFDSIANGEPGELWTFTATLASNAAGLSLRVQSTLTPAIEGSWTDLPGGGSMTRSGDTWTHDTADIPPGFRFFRVIAAAPGATDSTDVFATPFNITTPAGRILYVNRTSNELSVMEADGSARAELTSSAFALDGALNATSTLAAFVGDGGQGFGLYVMKATVADATNVPVLITTSLRLGSPVTWSPDGKRLAFCRNDGVGYGLIVVLNVVDGAGAITPEGAGNAAVQLTNFQFSDNHHPAWGPDGKFIAFTRDTSIVALSAVGAGDTITPESGANAVTYLTQYNPGAPVQATAASWDFTGTQIVFENTHQNPTTFQITGTSLSMLTVKNGAGVLTPESGANPRVALTTAAADPVVSAPSWSADGSVIVFTARPASGPQENIFKLNAVPESVANPRVALTTNADGGGRAARFSQPVAPIPTVPAATDFTIASAPFGEEWTFTVTQSAPGVTLRVQSSLTPDDPGSWQDLPGGGEMTDIGGDSWQLITDDLPLGDRSFRVISSADGLAPHTLASAVVYPISLPAGRIVYGRTFGGSTYLMRMEADGSAKTALTDGTISVGRPALSPDGVHAAFTRPGGLMVMKAVPMGPANTPVNVISTALLSINDLANIAWSPNGRHIAFASSNGQIQVIEAVNENGNINTPENAADTLLSIVGGITNGIPTLAWSPDGRVIAYTEADTVFGITVLDEFDALIPAGPANLPVALTIPGPAPAGTSEPLCPSWSPDGQRLAFVEFDRTGALTTSRIVIVQVRDELAQFTPEEATTNPRVPLYDFTRTPFTRVVSWSPDGALLALDAEVGNEMHIEVIKPEPIDAGTNPRVELTTFATDGSAAVPAFRQTVGEFSALQKVSFQSLNYAGNEESGPIAVRVIRTGSGAGPLTVGITITGGTATEGTGEDDLTGDFTIPDGPVVFADGETVKDFLVVPINDGEENEGDETILLSLDAPDIGQLADPDTATVVIHDNESNQQPFTPPASELSVLINGKKKTKGKTKTGAVLRFLARQDAGSDLSGLEVKIQATATPEDAGSWLNLPEAGMSRNSPSSVTWFLSTRLFPTGTVYFRTRSYSNAHRSNAGPVVGPFVIEPAPLLDIVARPRSGFTRPSEFLLYDVTWRNIGTAPALPTVVAIGRPRLTTFDTATNLSGGLRDGIPTTATRKIYYDIGTLAPGQSQTETIHFRVDPDAEAGDEIKNYLMSISAKGASAAISETITPVIGALKITIDEDPNVAGAGDVIRYTIRASNEAAFAVTGATVTNQLPAGTFIEEILGDDGTGSFRGTPLNRATLTATSTPVSFTPFALGEQRVVTWHLGTIPPNTEREIRFSVRVQYDVPGTLFNADGSKDTVEIQNRVFSFFATPPSGGIVQAFPGAKKDQPGAVPGEFVARTLISEADPAAPPVLSLTKHADGDGTLRAAISDEKRGVAVPTAVTTVVPGGDIIYTLSYRNEGDSRAENIVIFDSIPPEFTFAGDITANGGALHPDFYRFFDKRGKPLPYPGHTIDQDLAKVSRIEWRLGSISARSFGRLSYRVTAHNPVTLKPVKEGKAAKPVDVITSDYYMVTESLNTFVFGAPRQTVVRVVEPLTLAADATNSPKRVRPGEVATYHTAFRNNSDSLAASNVGITQEIPDGFVFTGSTSSGSFPVALYDAKGHEITEPATTDAVRERVATVLFNVGTLPGFTPADPANPAAQGVVSVFARLRLETDAKFPDKIVNTDFVPPQPRLFWDYTRPAPKRARLPRGRFVANGEGPTDASSNTTANGETQRVEYPIAPALWCLKKSPLGASSGGSMTYSIMAGNGGTEAANDIVVEMQIPSGTTFVSADNGGKKVGGNVQWKLGALPPSTERGMSFSVRVTLNSGTVYDNSCVAHSSNAGAFAAGPSSTTVAVTNLAGHAETIWNNILGAFGINLRGNNQAAVRPNVKQIKADGFQITFGGTTAITNESNWMIIQQGADCVIAIGPAGIVAGGGGNIVAGGGGNIVAGIGGNITIRGTPLTADNLVGIARAIEAGQPVLGGGGTIVAAGGGNVISHNGNALIRNDTGQSAGAIAGRNATIVAGGGGNIVAAGGGNIVAAGGGNIVAGGGGNIVAGGGGNVVTRVGGNIVAGGGENIVAGGGGNIVAGGGGN